jgi:hypothetical protein
MRSLTQSLDTALSTPLKQLNRCRTRTSRVQHTRDKQRLDLGWEMQSNGLAIQLRGYPILAGYPIVVTLLKDLSKDSNPLETAEYAVARDA